MTTATDNSSAETLFTAEDRQQIRARGISQETVLAQLETFRKGIPPPKLKKACTVGEGITVIDEREHERLTRLYEDAAEAGRTMKFVPASGAATRMFKLLLAVLNDLHSRNLQGLKAEAEYGRKDYREYFRFIENLKKFAFYDDLKEELTRQQSDIERLLAKERHREILNCLLHSPGLNYAELPKGLIKFHRYPDGSSRTPFEEHLVEAAAYTRDRKGTARIHFTIPDSNNPEHEVISYINTVKHRYEQAHAVQFDISFSYQSPATDTIAVDLSNRPFRDQQGRLHFRPGGHGALLENLNRLDGDIVLLKNIDNVVPDRLKGETYKYKGILGGYLVAIQQQLFAYLRQLREKNVGRKALQEMFDFAGRELFLDPPPAVKRGSRDAQVNFLFEHFNRPLRVCGMVKKEGEPGGGPFLVEQEDGSVTLQVVETSQIDQNDPQQKRILQSATHFSPADFVCGMRDYRGRAFNLQEFSDLHSGFISRKSNAGRELKALELPGLWNGGMAYWNTVFVEVPNITFNPVKTVFDLLRPEHQPQEHVD